MDTGILSIDFLLTYPRYFKPDDEVLITYENGRTKCWLKDIDVNITFDNFSENLKGKKVQVFEYGYEKGLYNDNIGIILEINEYYLKKFDIFITEKKKK